MEKACVFANAVSLSTDIMVDMPDEQSIVTYVAQFLERFPELEPVRFFPLLLIQNYAFSLGPQGTQQGLGLRHSMWLVANKVTSSSLPYLSFGTICDIHQALRWDRKPVTSHTYFFPFQT